MTEWFESIMSNDSPVLKRIFPDTLDFCGVDPDALLRGEVIENWNPHSSARSTAADRDGDPDDVVFAGLEMLPLFSPRLQLVLERANIGTEDIQYLPVCIFRSDGSAIDHFSVANIVQRVRALNRARCFLLSEDESGVDPLTGRPKITAIGRIAVHPEPLRDHDAVRLVEFSRAMLVSERFVKVFNDNGCTGVHFSKLNVSS